MKLLTKYNRVNSIATVIALAVSGIFYYYFIHYQLINQLDKDLKIEELEIIDYVTSNKILPNASTYKDQSISFQLIKDQSIKRSFYSRSIFNKEENEWEPIREISFPVQVKGEEYKATVSKSQLETDNLIQLILLITMTIVVSLLTSLFFINRFLLSKMWRPFTTTLQQLQLFNLTTAKQQLQLEKTDINEFVDLNNAVHIMSRRVSMDYEALKSFTENASHEIQTPIAIIQSKAELLIQSENLQAEQARNIQAIYDASIRMTKLNKSLILLTKIDNHQFRDKEEINLAGLIRSQLNNYEELIDLKQLSVTATLDDNSVIVMNDVLAEILFSNLLTNAIKHNNNNGTIDILLKKNKFNIANSGARLKTSPVELFERFKKNNQESSSLGLGLSIVKKICDQYSFGINYDYDAPTHTLTVQF